MTRNQNLDLLRTVAVTLVMVGHLPAAPRETLPIVLAVADWFRAYGSLGVDLFFVLSGFLVSGLLFREYLIQGRANVGRFLIRRGFKIYPAFYVFLFITIALRIRLGDSLTFSQILSEALFVQNYGAHVWSHTWSLAVEEHFYLLLAALVAFLCWRLPRQPLTMIPLIFCGTTAAVAVARVLTIAHAPYATVTHRFPTHLQIDSLFTGVVLSYYYHTRPGFGGAVRRHALILASGAAVCLIAAQSIAEPMTRFVAGHLLTNAGFGAIVVIAIVLPASRGWFSRAGGRIGAQSYSIYLWHAAVMAFGAVIVPRLLGRAAGFYETAAWYLPASFAVGLLMAKTIELPVLRMRDRWFPDDRRPVAASAPRAASVMSDAAVEPAVSGTIPTVGPALPR